jgi:hypothetical protein
MGGLSYHYVDTSFLKTPDIGSEFIVEREYGNNIS